MCKLPDFTQNHFLFTILYNNEGISLLIFIKTLGYIPREKNNS